MTALAALLLPLVVALVIIVRDRRAKERLFQAELAAEREETRLRYLQDEEITERRQSFSAWPWGNR